MSLCFRILSFWDGLSWYHFLRNVCMTHYPHWHSAQIFHFIKGIAYIGQNWLWPILSVPSALPNKIHLNCLLIQANQNQNLNWFVLSLLYLVNKMIIILCIYSDSKNWLVFSTMYMGRLRWIFKIEWIFFILPKSLSHL